MEEVQLHFSFRNKFINLLACGHLVENSTFSKMFIFKSLTGYTNYVCYFMKRDSAYNHIRDKDHIVAARSVFILHFHPGAAAYIISVSVHSSKIVIYQNVIAEDIRIG